MDDTNCGQDVTAFVEMFKDRFTEKDTAFMELKAKPLSHPTIIFPWKTMQKQWNKRWDHSRGRQTDRDSPRRNEYRHHKQNFHDRYRDRSESGESSNYRSRRHDNDNPIEKHYNANQDKNSYYDERAGYRRDHRQNHHGRDQKTYNDRS